VRSSPNKWCSASGIARHSHQYAWRGSDDVDKAHSRCANADGLSPKRNSRSSGCNSLQQRHRLRLPDGLRPQTLYGIADSPVGLAPIPGPRCLELRADLTRLSGEAAGLTRDDVLDNITITWLTNTAISGARLYWESKLRIQCQRRSIPVAVSAFPTRSICAAQLGGAGVSQTDPLQQARQRRALCGLGTAATLFRRGSRGFRSLR